MPPSDVVTLHLHCPRCGRKLTVVYRPGLHPTVFDCPYRDCTMTGCYLGQAESLIDVLPGHVDEPD